MAATAERVLAHDPTPIAARREACFHCAEPVEPRSARRVDFDGAARELCCPGCEAVMRGILDAGLDDYYRHRTAPAGTRDGAQALSLTLDALAVYDEPEVMERYVRDADGTDGAGDAEVSLAVEGMRCGACVWLLERSVRGMDGVSAASFNFSTGRARVRFDATRVPVSALLRRVAEVGYAARPFDARTREAALTRESRQMLQRLFVAGIAMMQVMMYALPAYLAGAGDIEPAHEQLLRWASLVLTVPVMTYSATPFFSGAWRDLRAGRPGMDVPVSIGLLAAFGASVHATLTMRGEIWFDSIAMFAFLLLGARWLEWRARRRALRAIDDLGAEAPESAEAVASDGRLERVPVARLAPGMRVRVASGERVPADARVAHGHGAVDLSLLTGESVPVEVSAGADVPGGALVTGTPLELVVTRAASASALSTIERLIERGGAEKPAIVRTADRVAAAFVGVLLAFATLVFVLWWRIDPARAATVAVATLVVSCPCALSLATPAALAAATGRLLRDRLVVTRGHAIETLARVTDVVFDKTGTLTLGRPELVGVVTAPGQDRDAAVALAAALEAGAAHPFAGALRAAASSMSATVPSPPDDVHHEPGGGVAGTLADGTRVRLGSARWCGLDDAVAAAWRARAAHEMSGAARTSGSNDAGATSDVFLVREAADEGGDGAVEPLARFGFADPVRPEAAAAVAALRARGLRVHLLSGDRRAVVDAVADALGIEARRGEATPADKQATVAALQADGATVLMVGDGINDAPVLALADVSLAVGAATALARTAADVISLAPTLDALERLLAHARRTVRVVRQNLAWAASYNAVAIPAAALGWVPPWAAAVGMATSSLVVAGNALRLSARGPSAPARG